MKIAIDLQNDTPTNGDVLKALFPDDNPVTARASLDRTLRKWWNEPYVVSVDKVETIEDDCPETNRKKSERGETERSLLFAPSRRTVSTFIWETKTFHDKPMPRKGEFRTTEERDERKGMVAETMPSDKRLRNEHDVIST